MNELRAIWREDQYQTLQAHGDSSTAGRVKGDRYQVFRRDSSGRRRELLIEVPLDRDRFWCSESHTLVETPVMARAVHRGEDILNGHSFDGRATGCLRDLSPFVQSIELKTAAGASAVLLLPQEIESWFVSLHGGPESQEGREIRYGGLYRELLTRKTAVLIVNYRGSLGAPLSVRRSAWGRWRESITEDFTALLALPQLRNFNTKAATFFGASFGGALALILHREFGAARVILSSPLLDLEAQIQRGGHRYRRWFQTRFSEQDRFDFSFESLSPVRGNITCLMGRRDEVLGREILEKLKSLEPGWTVVEQDRGHAPQTYREFAEWRKGLGL